MSKRGGRPRKPRAEKRGRTVAFRLTPEETREFEREAKRLGMTLSEFTRLAVQQTLRGTPAEGLPVEITGDE